MQIYSIGFTKKSAEQFFELLIDNSVSTLFDVRRNITSQLAGFAKGRDLKYLLNKVAEINYYHLTEYAPPAELLKRYRDKEVTWDEYEVIYNAYLDRYFENHKIDVTRYENGVFLCSEHEPTQCHRRLLVEKLKSMFPKINIKHLV